MELIVLALIPVAVIVWVMKARARRATPPAPTFDAPVPTFRVVALGVSGAGKTTYLASMFHELNFPTARRSFYLDVEPEDRIRLNGVYAKVSDPEASWPRATGVGEMKEYRFRCIGSDEDRSHKRTVLNLTYLDFAGGLLEGHNEPTGEAFTGLIAAIGSASALLVLIDGGRVRQVLIGDPRGRAYFERTLRATVGFAQNATCPIHFVITKWDLIQSMGAMRNLDEGGRLRTVGNVLFQYEHLAALLHDPARQQIVRLIPVSSVGPDFVALDADGMPVKRANGTISPTNVDAPLAAVVPDLFRQVESKLDAQTRSTLAKEVRSRLARGSFLPGLTGLVALPVGAVVKTALSTALTPFVADTVYTLFLDWVAGVQQAAAQRGPAPGAGAEQEIAIVRAIRGRVMADFTRSVYRLEDRYPTSLLTR